MQIQPGQQVKIIMTPTSGDLIPFVGVSPAADQAFARLKPQEDGITFIFDPGEINAVPADDRYIIAASRQGAEDGTTSGDFDLQVMPIESAQG